MLTLSDGLRDNLRLIKKKTEKKKRVWKKKISYDCKKRVADNRLKV